MKHRPSFVDRNITKPNKLYFLSRRLNRDGSVFSTFYMLMQQISRIFDVFLHTNGRSVQKNVFCFINIGEIRVKCLPLRREMNFEQ